MKINDPNINADAELSDQQLEAICGGADGIQALITVAHLKADDANHQLSSTVVQKSKQVSQGILQNIRG
ncbi:MAG: hypothetical protein MH252_03800 [Thermosynechococcaceae cyanobacterium MS004]|nr:hypothetical protein [Thermosynechococcaceae cyanobacterium MS004]